MSDDAHAVDQVGLNYSRALNAIRKAGIEVIHYFSSTSDDCFGFEPVSVAEIEGQLSAMI